MKPPSSLPVSFAPAQLRSAQRCYPSSAPPARAAKSGPIFRREIRGFDLQKSWACASPSVPPSKTQRF